MSSVCVGADWLSVRGRPVLVAASRGAVRFEPQLACVARQIDVDQEARAWTRSQARATLVARVARAQAAYVRADECRFMMALGERFFWWGYGSEGAVFWRALSSPLAAHLGPASAALASASEAALGILAGERVPALSGAREIERVLGADHPMTRAVIERVRARSVFPPMNDGPLGTTPNADHWCAPRAAEWDAETRAALWIVLALLSVTVGPTPHARRTLDDGGRVEGAFGEVGLTLSRAGLPDVASRFGLRRLLDMSDDAMLEELTAELTTRPFEERRALVEAVWDLADFADEGAIPAIERLGAWLGICASYD